MQAVFSSRSSAFLASPGLCRRSSAVAVAPVRPAVVVVEAKLKTRKAAAKRFKVTGSGKITARHAGKQHMNEKMSTNHKRALSGHFTLAAGDAYAAAKELPYAR
ncbi:50S ribosomal protein L35 [Raphidocelis subcapitata]|uniref:50S ribosomal protein L35 n=1 Tax=Raphidocelis subcapitata TaxID=307507 RepID=A0A2V0NQP0_9CHLO|nr:50S ribosomal protein L35 [Raphidocelis subcapitata]|eukprot:GBF89951.1 50S ribosomal protein L35 [Raphidocelis subcapitata]